MVSKKDIPSRFTRFVVYPIVGLAFVIALAIVLMLATGYKITIDNYSLVFKKTGMIIISSKPSDAAIYLNNESLGKRTFPFLSTKITSLLPGNYTLTVKKDGYYDWQKNLTVYPDLVTWANYILLFPKDNKPDRLSEIDGYQIDATNRTNKNLLMEKREANGQNHLYIYDTGNHSLSQVWPGTVSPVEDWLKNPRVLAGEFNSDSKRILLTLQQGKKSAYAVLDLNGTPRLYQFKTTPELPYSKLIWNPENANEIVGLSNGVLYRIAFTGSQLTSTKTLEGVVDYTVKTNNQMYYVVNADKIYSVNKAQTDGSRQSQIAESVTASNSYRFEYSSKNNVLAVLAEGPKNLTAYYEINNLGGSIQLCQDCNGMSWNKDGSRLNYYNDSTIFSYDWEKQKETSSKSPSKILEMKWYFDNYHLYVRTDKGLYVVDYDGANQIQLNDTDENSILVSQSSFIYSKAKNGKSEHYRLNLSF